MQSLSLICKVAGLSWPTVEFLLHDRLAGKAATKEIIELAKRDYSTLTKATAQRTLRFMQIRDTVK